MKLPENAHTSRPWRIHELTPDFDVEDVWELPTPGGPHDLPRLVHQVAWGNGDGKFSGLTRLLFAIRWRLGAMLGWDKPEAGVGARVATLRDRLPDDLRDGPAGPDFRTVPFRSLFALST